MTPKLGIILVNWNRKVDTLRCIESVYESTFCDWELLVVDNASADDSVATIQSLYPAVTIQQTGKNLGFTGGNNAGIRYFLERDVPLILLLNNDATVAPDALEKLVNGVDQSPEADFFGTRICSMEDAQTILSAGGTLQNGWEPVHGKMLDTKPYQVEVISGCSFLVRASAVRQIGMLADEMFIYHEDTEWCYRALQAGMQLMIIPDSIVYHPDTRSRDQLSTFVTYYETRNSLLFAKMHRFAWWTRLQMWRRLVQTAISWSVRPRWRHKRPQRDAMMWGLIDFLRGRTGIRGGAT